MGTSFLHNELTAITFAKLMLYAWTEQGKKKKK